VSEKPKPPLFIASHEGAPSGLVLDIDASDIELHGNQERREFHGYYDHHCLSRCLRKNVTERVRCLT